MTFTVIMRGKVHERSAVASIWEKTGLVPSLPVFIAHMLLSVTIFPLQSPKMLLQSPEFQPFLFLMEAAKERWILWSGLRGPKSSLSVSQQLMTDK